jgi:hypothetical protein
MSKLRTGLIVGASLLATAATAADQSSPGQIYKSATCDCCSAWMAHMKGAGFTLEPKDMANKDLHRFKVHLGLKPDQNSCHTALIGGYVIEGHVPADDVKRLLAEKPDAIGLSVPGMPIGSPGMEQGDNTQPYEVLLLKKDGTTEVFARY